MTRRTTNGDVLGPGDGLDRFYHLDVNGKESRVPPKQKPGRSKQDYRTPVEFLDAVKHRLGIERFAMDVAASAENAVAPLFYTEQTSGLEHPWSVAGWNWLNPPYARIAPWVEKAAAGRAHGVRTAMLLPAGVGSNWWSEYVHGKACVLLLNGRLTFVGETTPYPKDCVLLLYGPDVAPGYEVWAWQQASGRKAA